jgi:hypothetical protein
MESLESRSDRHQMTIVIREQIIAYCEVLGGMQCGGLGSALAEANKDSARQLVPVCFPGTWSERLLTLIVREYGDDLSGQRVAMLSPLLPNLIEGLGAKVRDIHNELVAKPLEGHGWANLVSQFSW